jgi:hypothetical protein
MLVDRNRILKSATVQNPSVVKMDQQITSLKVLFNLVCSMSRVLSKKRFKRERGVLDAKIGKIRGKSVSLG